jgi:hypothetical protein
MYYSNTQGLYYNSQFDLDKVKQEIFTIRNSQNTLTQDLIKFIIFKIIQSCFEFFLFPIF